LGWHSNDGYDDIGLACFDKEGTLENTFIESLSSLATSGKMELSGDFRFARMDGAVNSIENLSVLWTEPVADELQSETTLYYDVLKAARFVEYNGVYTLSAPSEIASMNERPAGGEEKSTTVDHFDAYVATDDGATIKAVILGSEFDGTFRVIDALTGMEVDPLSVEPDYLYNIFVPNTQSKLFTATGVYENRIDVPAVSYDYETLMTDILMTLSFTVENLGCEPITDISININNTGDTLVTKSEFILLPNQSHTFSIDYKVGSKIEDLSYTITAGFAKGGKDTYDGEVFMEIHDVGISQMRTVSEQDGIREVEVLLYNMSEIPLKGSGKTVRLGIFEDAAYTTLISDIDRQMGDEAISITDDTSLGLIDEGAYVLRFTFNIANYLKNNGGYEEIPESERYLFSKCWIEEADGTENYEYYQANNTAYIGFDSLLIRNGNAPVTLTSAMSNDNDASTVSVRLQNNSLRQKSEGNLIALLLDGEGNIIESMQSYNALGGYISLTGEGIYDMEFHFSKLGAAAHMAYSDFVLGDNSNANLSVLTFSGIPVDLSDFENSSNVSYTGGFSGNLLVTAIAEDPNATVTITANGSVVPSYDGAATLNISSGRTPLTVTVTAVDKTTKTYALDIDNGSGGGSSGGGSSTTTGTVTFDTNGGSKISSKSVTFGETISKPTDPTKEGFTFAGWYTDAALTQTFDFNTKITKNTTIYAKWTEYLAYEGWLNPFIDVKESDWFYDSVKFAHQNGLFSGTSTTTFSPSNTMTRGMMVTGLWRLGGSPTVGSPAAGSAAFTDVPTGAWYADAVNWAAANGIVSGVGGNLFAPNDEITREQMAVMLNNYAKFVDAELPKEREGVFADEDKISSWAKEAVNAMYAAKILNGKGANDFDPQGRATRAEVAEMFKRFIEAAVSLD